MNKPQLQRQNRYSQFYSNFFLTDWARRNLTRKTFERPVRFDFQRLELSNLKIDPKDYLTTQFNSVFLFELNAYKIDSNGFGIAHFDSDFFSIWTVCVKTWFKRLLNHPICFGSFATWSKRVETRFKWLLNWSVCFIFFSVRTKQFESWFERLFNYPVRFGFFIWTQLRWFEKKST